MRSLQLLSDAANGRLAESIRRAGGMVPLLWDGQTSFLTWQVKLSLSPSPEHWLTYRLTLARLGIGGAYEIDLEQLDIEDIKRKAVTTVMRRAQVSRLEKGVEPDGSNLIPVLHTLYTTDRNFKIERDEAMWAAFGPDFDELLFPPAEDGRVQLRVRWRSWQREQSAADLSDGMLRFLFLLTVLASPAPPAPPAAPRSS